ncbi:hypothetical protein [Cellulosimicrobium sp. TH-20]|uniref:hypothetical protein n=1 Tax=Cellulosimicrobium sp. TH-20 TaxID=1980001 RepID=UPI001582B8C3
MVNDTLAARPRPASLALALAVPATLLLGACGVVPSEVVEKKASDGASGKESGLLADWVPDEATDVVVLQRATGAERLLVASYDGDLSGECRPVAEEGAPSREELVAAYRSDERTQRVPVDKMAEVRTLEADWWPDDQEARTTMLCGRWWVSQEGGTIFAFTPDLATAVDGAARNR